MAITDIFGGSNNKSESKTELPNYVTEGGKAAVGIAKDIANQPYTPYPGPRVAPMRGNEKMAYDVARNTRGDARKMVSSGFGLARDIGTGNWDATKAMNPFTDAVIKRINEQAAQDAIGARAGIVGQGGVGAFGDARTGVIEGQLEEGRLGAIGAAYADEYNKARDAALRSADLMGVSGGRFGAVTSGEIGDLGRTGATQRGVGQASLDAAYQDFLEQRDWAQRGLNAYTQALTGTPFDRTTTSETPSPSAAQQVVGLGVAGAGLYSMFFS
jgi:hypothetical protein